MSIVLPFKLQSFCLILLLFVAQPAFAQAIFTSNVSVDVTGEDAADARAKAMKQAEREGLSQLLVTLVPDRRDALMNLLDDKIIAAMVKGTEVLEEKITGTRYRAQLKVTYDAVAITELTGRGLTQEGISETLEHSPAVLVIPVYEENGQVTLWESANPWRAAWAQVGLERNGGNVIVPYGDSVDSGVIKTDNYQAATINSLVPLINRYGVSEVVVLKATYKASPEMGIDIQKHQISRDNNETFTLEYRADLEETKETLLKRAARDLAEQIERQREETLSRKALGGAMAEGTLMVLTPLSTMDAWTVVRKNLEDLPGIQKIEVVAVSPQQVDFLLHFRGPQDSLARAIRGKKLRLIENANYWVVSRD